MYNDSFDPYIDPFSEISEEQWRHRLESIFLDLDALLYHTFGRVQLRQVGTGFISTVQDLLFNAYMLGRKQQENENLSQRHAEQDAQHQLFLKTIFGALLSPEPMSDRDIALSAALALNGNEDALETVRANPG